MATMPPAVLALVNAKVQSALGIDDTTDFVSALQSLDKSELAEYLGNVLGDETAAKEIATLMGAVTPAEQKPPGPPQKASEVDWSVGTAKGKKKGGNNSASSSAAAAPAASPAIARRALVGGATVTQAKPNAKEKQKKAAEAETARADDIAFHRALPRVTTPGELERKLSATRWVPQHTH